MSQEIEPGAVYQWQVLEDGQWGVIATALLKAGQEVHFPLTTRDERMARVDLRPFAESHKRSTGLPVRLHRFIPDPNWGAEEV